MLKSYASYFVAFLLQNIAKPDAIERITLYGSVAKGEETKDSDIDIFIEVKKQTKQREKEIQKIVRDFYKSREASLFKVKEIENKFSIKIGIIREWKELYKSIASTGITLYGSYEAKELPSGVKQSIIIFWSNIGKNRGSFLNKIYGFRIHNKSYAGLLTKYEGKKLGKSCIIMPSQYKKEIFVLLREHQVNAKVMEVFS
ncbi:nucleotidyltransferase domain-containing protein [Candidatus Woesearchaeota archaeon]|nr:nucleotidyltransferase domain-containing protein [Candidatus Woesearchaeota archaeon]